MKKRIFTIFLFLILIFATSGCSTKKISRQEVLDANVQQPLQTISTSYEFTLREISNLYYTDDSYINLGLIIITKKDDDKKSVYSLFTGQILFEPLNNIWINIFQRSSMAYVAVERYVDDTTALFDFFGNILLPYAQYESYSVSGRFYSEDDNQEEEIYIETLTFSKIDDFSNQLKTETRLTKIDLSTYQRTAYSADDIKPEKIAQYVNENLAMFGLPNHYAKFMPPFSIYIYEEKNNKFVNHINITNGDFVGALDGKMFIQSIYSVSEFKESKYTYTDIDGVQFYLITEVVDILSGKKQEIKVDYLIDELYPIMDKKGNYKFGFATIYDIKDKYLSEIYRNVIIDSSGKIIHDFGAIELGNLVKLNNQYYYDYDSEFLFDKNLRPTLYLRNVQGFDLEKEFIFLRQDGNYGIINYQGDIILPFEYKSLQSRVIDNKVFIVDYNNDNIIYDLNGNRVVLQPNVRFLAHGLLLQLGDNASFINYNLESLFQLNSVEETDSSTKRIYLYNQYLVKNFVDAAGNKKYVLIKVTEEFNTDNIPA